MTFTGGHVTGKPNSLQEAELYCSAGDGMDFRELLLRYYYYYYYYPIHVSFYMVVLYLVKISDASEHTLLVYTLSVGRVKTSRSLSVYFRC